jgi:hypothetical protein
MKAEAHKNQRNRRGKGKYRAKFEVFQQIARSEQYILASDCVGSFTLTHKSLVVTS